MFRHGEVAVLLVVLAVLAGLLDRVLGGDVHIVSVGSIEPLKTGHSGCVSYHCRSSVPAVHTSLGKKFFLTSSLTLSFLSVNGCDAPLVIL